MTSPPPDVLAIGHAAALHINRAVYRALMRRGVAVELAVPTALPRHASNRPVEAAQPDDPPLHWLQLRGANLRYYRFVGLRALLERRRPRLIHLDNEPDTPLAWWLGRWAARNAAQLTCQSLETGGARLLPPLLRGKGRDTLRALRTRIGIGLSRRHIAAVFCHNQAALENLRHLGLAERGHWVPLGFDNRLFAVSETARQVTRRELKLTQTTIAYFGRLVPAKGVHLLIEALAMLKQEPWQLLLDHFDGDDAYGQRLTAMLRDQGLLERCVHFQASHQDMARFMNAADICVIPSLWQEQFGRVASEAMACGKALIASDIGALPEVVGKAGVLVPPGDPRALCHALSRLLGDNLARQNLGRAAAERARTSLSVDAQAQTMAEVFHHLLKQPRG